MNSKRLLLALGGAFVLAGVGSIPAAYAGGYPFNCPKQKVQLVSHTTGATTTFSSIQAAVDAAVGDPTGSGAGDTVIVCAGTFNGNVSIDGPTKSNVTLRSWNDTNEAKVVGTGSGPVISITAPGVTLGGPGLGLTIGGTNPVGVQVGTPAPIDPNEDDDQEITDCPASDPDPTQCTDKEKKAFPTTNVSVVGNRIADLHSTGGVTGIAVNNTNNTMTFRNLVRDLSAGNGSIAFGIRYSDTNYNVDILGNAVQRLTQTGGGCGTPGTAELGAPTAGVVGVAVQDEALDALVYDTIVDNLSTTCTAVGVYSNAWGGLENDRNGQQVPIATDLVDNRIKKISGADSAGVVLGPVVPETKDNESPPSAFRVLANDIDETKISIAVVQELGASSYIRENDLDTDTIGVLNTGATNLDATNNWWGCEEGPASGKKECAKIVDAGTGVTSYNPWLKNHVDHAGAHAGEYAGHN